MSHVSRYFCCLRAKKIRFHKLNDFETIWLTRAISKLSNFHPSTSEVDQKNVDRSIHWNSYNDPNKGIYGVGGSGVGWEGGGRGGGGSGVMSISPVVLTQSLQKYSPI